LCVGALAALFASCTFSTRGLEVVPGVDVDGSGGDGRNAGEDTSAVDARPDRDGGDGTVDRVADHPPSDLGSLDRALDTPMPLGTGSPCSAGGLACATGFCIDGVCCENACPAGCRACAAGKTGAANGLCRPIPVGMDPDAECPDQGMASCKRSGSCDGLGACSIYPRGTTCGAGSCSGSMLVPPRTCDGAGTCDPGQPSPCDGGFACASNQTCKTSCTVDADCAANLGCDTTTGSCSIMKKLQGQACNSSPECASNTCADGVCCDTPCGGLCLACLKTLTGAENGTCADIMAGVRPTRLFECPLQRTTCGNNGLCDGAGGCQQTSDGTQCGTYCCGPGNSNANVCRMLCDSGACSDQSGVVVASCVDDSLCTTDRCETVGTTHVCHNDVACGGNSPCCCVGPAIGTPMCTDTLGCTLGLGNTCMP
jgi:hypothetical protein